MELSQLIFNVDPLEPETVRHLFPELSSFDIVKILTTKVILQTNAAFEDMDIFENCVWVLNDITPDVYKMEGCSPLMIWKAIDNIRKIRKEFELSYEVLMYIKYIFNLHNLYFYPQDIGLDNALTTVIISNLDNKDADEFLSSQIVQYKKLISEL